MRTSIHKTSETLASAFSRLRARRFLLFVCMTLIAVGLMVGAQAAAPAAAPADDPALFTDPLEIALDPADVTITRTPDGVTIHLRGGVIGTRAGEPAVPTWTRSVPLPAGAVATGLRISTLETTTLEVGDVAPLSPPAIPGHEPPAAGSAQAMPRDERIYASPEPFPAEPATLQGTSHGAGRPYAIVRLHPLRFLPQRGLLQIHTRMVLEVRYRFAPAAAGARLLPPREHPQTNPGAPALSPAWPSGSTALSSTPHGRASGWARVLDANRAEYIIITTPALAPAFEALAAWKSQKGVPAQVATVDAIEAGWPGEDLAARVRAYLRTAYEERGAAYALLAGPPHEVGFRHAFAMDCEVSSPLANLIPADLYFADLDGDWNADQDTTYGEVEDEVDLYPDLYVGRVTTYTFEQAAAWVEKVLTYERMPPTDYQMRVLMMGEISFSDPYTDDGVGLDRIDELIFRPDYDPITKLYESRGNESRESVVAALNEGPHLALHCGHAGASGMSVGDGTFNAFDAGDLTNGPRTFLFYSVGCFAAAFDTRPAVLGELLRNTSGGAFAAIGNTRFGWASPGNPGFGYSEILMRGFHENLILGGITQLGVALAEAKADLIAYAREQNVYRWHQYCVNLLGDPEQPVYTRQPVLLQIHAPERVPTGAAEFGVVVTGGDQPVAGARVCLSGAQVPLMVGWTDASGRLQFELQAASATTATLTATAPNHIAAEIALPIAPAGEPQLVVDEIRIDDDNEGSSRGNGDGEVNAGETIELRVTLVNQGETAAEEVQAVLTPRTEAATAVLDHAEWPRLDPGPTTGATGLFAVTVDSACAPGDGITLDLTLTAAGGREWSETAGLRVVDADPRVTSCRLVEIAGDGDGVIDPGETAMLEIELHNRGNGTLPPVAATLVSADPYVTVTDGAASLRNALASGKSEHLGDALIARISGLCPMPNHAAELDLELAADDRLWNVPLTLVLGGAGFAEDAESAGHPGAGSWETVDEPWHIDTSKARSGQASWRCADPATGTYGNNLDAILESPTFACPSQAELRFWRTYDVATYGTDGVYVQVAAEPFTPEPDWHTLDYLGSGGALGGHTLQGTGAPGTLNIEGDWAEMVYPLNFAPATPIRLRLRFVSDASENGEGFYIDDLVVRDGSAAQADVRIASGTVWPNPFAEQLFLQLELPAASPVRLSVLDVSGRQVRRLADRTFGAGSYRLLWDGRDERGQRVASGLYYVRLDRGTQTRDWRVVHLR